MLKRNLPAIIVIVLVVVALGYYFKAYTSDDSSATVFDVENTISDGEFVRATRDPQGKVLARGDINRDGYKDAIVQEIGCGASCSINLVIVLSDKHESLWVFAGNPFEGYLGSSARKSQISEVHINDGDITLTGKGLDCLNICSMDEWDNVRTIKYKWQDGKIVRSQDTSNTESQCQAANTPEIQGLTYDDARIEIIAAEWKPIQTHSSIDDFPSMTGNITIFWNNGYTELQDCAGTGLGQCLFLFQDSCGNYLHINTAGEEGALSNATVQTFSVNQSGGDF